MKLAVEVVRAHRLKPTGRHGTTNPFVEVEFDGQRRRTATKLNDLNPSWNETLVFDVSDPLDLPDRTIDVSVFHERLSSSVDHRRRRRSFLGRVCLLGSSVASSRLDAALQLCPLDKRSLFFNVRGEITLRLYAVPDAYEAQAADGHRPLSSVSAPTIVLESIPSSSTILESIPSTISAAETLPPKSTVSVGEMMPPKKKSHRSFTKEKERREFRSVGTPSATGKSQVSQTTEFFSNHERSHHRSPQSYYRANHDLAGPAVAASVQQAPPPKIEYGIVETHPPLAALMGYRLARNSDKIKSTYDLVEQMEFLFVRIVRARNLPAMDIVGSLDPYVVVKLGNFTNKTNHRERNRDPEWENVFAFSKGHIQAQRLEVVLKDKNFIKDDIVGDVAIELPEVPLRAPPDGPVAPQWYRLRKGNNRDDDAYRGEIMMAVWMGTQADEVYPDALHSDAHLLPLASIPHTRSKVYFSPRMSYLRVNVISAQDLKPSRPDPAIYIKVQLGAQLRWTLVSSDRSPDPTWKNEELMLVACEPFDEPLVLMVQDRLLPNKDETLAKLEIRKGAIRTRADHHKPFAPQWFNLDNPNGSSGSGNGSGYGKLQLRVYYDNNYHVIDERVEMSSDHPIGSDEPTTKGSHLIRALGEHPSHGDLRDEHPATTSERYWRIFNDPGLSPLDGAPADPSPVSSEAFHDLTHQVRALTGATHSGSHTASGAPRFASGPVTPTWGQVAANPRGHPEPEALSSDSMDSLRAQLRFVNQRLDEVQKEVRRSKGDFGEDAHQGSLFSPEI
ncbi:unnamed protein product [Musa acuminata subsp. malaccensis]|uniref:(wild Malaysian banana) hypothetical protein n=1 Tax=Musa acuminata subsp. malaccensis TaxID=214687 RepID=A0A8D7FEZ4_MUSAM|nr:unnamed protein product [Musa acuminata subsp. malaccensis]